MPWTTVAVPWAGVLASVISSGPASGSVSLARTLNVVAPESSSTVRASSTAIGGSSTQVTVTETVAVSPPVTV